MRFYHREAVVVVLKADMAFSTLKQSPKNAVVSLSQTEAGRQ